MISLCIYVYVYIGVYIYMYVCVYTHTYTDMYVYAWVCVHSDIYQWVHPHSYFWLHHPNKTQKQAFIFPFAAQLKKKKKKQDSVLLSGNRASHLFLRKHLRRKRCAILVSWLWILLYGPKYTDHCLSDNGS